MATVAPEMEKAMVPMSSIAYKSVSIFLFCEDLGDIGRRAVARSRHVHQYIGRSLLSLVRTLSHPKSSQKVSRGRSSFFLGTTLGLATRDVSSPIRSPQHDRV